MKEKSKIKMLKAEGIVKIELVSKLGNLKTVSEGNNHVFINSLMNSNIMYNLSINPEYSIPLGLFSKFDSGGVEIVGCGDAFDLALTNDIPFLPGRLLGHGEIGLGSSGLTRGSYVPLESYVPKIKSTLDGWDTKMVYNFGYDQAQGGLCNTLNWIGLTSGIITRSYGLVSLTKLWNNQAIGSELKLSVNGYLFGIDTNGIVFRKIKQSSGAVSDIITCGVGTVIPGYSINDDKYYGWNTTTNEIYELDLALGTSTAIYTSNVPTTQKPNTSFIKNGNNLLIINNADYYYIGSLIDGSVSAQIANKGFNYNYSNLLYGYLSYCNGLIISPGRNCYSGATHNGYILDGDFNQVGSNLQEDYSYYGSNNLIANINNASYVGLSKDNGIVNTSTRYALTGYKVDSFTRSADEGLKITYKLICNY